MKRIYEGVRHNPRILLEPNEQDRKKLIEIIQLYDKAANDFQGTWREETDDEVALRIFALNNVEYTGKLKVEGRAMRIPSEKNPHILTDIVFRYHKAVNNPKTLAIADAMVRIWDSQGYQKKWTEFRNIIEPIMRKYYY
ncbi:hypothetical protein JGH11_16560 [Dysgonomonas sp. Marseille-P4677]|uniref:hypothetical protein n=1 Tax=Dysgonomonas sp. Marseille-P4677 TaxID=2364790 RepID=UPI001911A6CF|nr:hypothetical protein [Dysgonomonas sp. Marseille-P4677]MBK5722487.1 hypothetical protein [Dysgonomonas sp. Marseille-P4677]